ncbi:MAG: hypothetical protein V4504_00805 [Patescibacteria group bacterium]
MRKEHILNSPRFEEYRNKKSKILKRKILIIFFLFVALVIACTFISRIEKIRIDQVVVSGNKVIDIKDVEAFVQKELQPSYLWLFPKNNSFIYPEKKIRKGLLEKFKRLTEVKLTVKDNKVLEISLVERAGKYLWCGDVRLENTIDQKCYFLNSDGYIFDEAPYFSDGIYLKFYGKIENQEKIGAYFMPDIFENIIHFKDLLEHMDLKVVSFLKQENGDMNMYLPSGAEIRFNTIADSNKLAQNLQATISTEPFKSLFKNNMNSLLYIDLRFGNKIYYKFNE